MITCNQCTKEVPLGDALLTQDFHAKPLAFCSGACRDIWIDRTLAPPLEHRAQAQAQDSPATGRGFAI